MSRRWLVSAGVGAALAAGGIFAFSGAQPPPEHLVEEPVSVGGMAAPRASTSENEAILARLRRIEGELERRPEAPVVDVAPVSGPSEEAEAETPYDDRTEEERELARALYRSQLEDVLDSEEVDPEWGPATESLLDESIAEFGAEGLALYGLECRSTLCRLEFTVDSEGNSFSAIDGLMGKPGFDLAGQADFEVDPDGTERIYVFLAREDGGFPEPAA